MRNDARRYVVSIIFVLLVGVAYSQTTIDDDKVLTNDSQKSVQNSDNKDLAEAGNKEAIKNESEVRTEDSEAIEAEAAAALKAKEAKAKSYRATAYCLRGKTASGKRVRRGIIAADPRVLPLGTKVEITSGRYAGEYLVADTGGKVKGRKIDIWVPNCREAIRWGNRGVKLTVLSKPTKRR